MDNFVSKFPLIETDIAVSKDVTVWLNCAITIWHNKNTYFLPAFLLCEKIFSKILSTIFPSWLQFLFLYLFHYYLTEIPRTRTTTFAMFHFIFSFIFIYFIFSFIFNLTTFLMDKHF